MMIDDTKYTMYFKNIKDYNIRYIDIISLKAGIIPICCKANLQIILLIVI